MPEKTTVTKLDESSEIIYIENFLNKQFATNLFNELKNNIPWTHGVYKMFGKDAQTSRLLYAMKDK